MHLSNKMGRPTESPKNKLLQVRVDNETLDKLDFCANSTQTSRSDVVRRGIDKVFDDIKK